MTGEKKTKRNKKWTITMRDLRRRMDLVYPILLKIGDERYSEGN